MRTINLNAIQAFLSVAEHGSYTQGAKSMGCSKAYLSEQVKSLEKSYKAQLIIRTTRKLTLTPAGEAFLARCKDALTQIQQAEELLLDEQTRIHGDIRIASAGGILGEEFVAPSLYEFMNLYPEINIEVNFSSQNVDLLSGNFDLAIRFGELRDSTLIAKRLISYRNHLLATPQYLKNFGKPKSPSELNLHRLIVGTKDTWELEKKGLKQTITPVPKLKAGNGKVMLNAALNHQGITMLPSIYVADLIDAGKLISILPEWTKKETSCHIIYPPSRYRLAKVQLLVSHLINDLSGK